MIVMAPWSEDVSVLMPVDVDRDPEGDLLVVGSRQGFTIRPLRNNEQVSESLRRRAHWATCPHHGDWVETMARLGLRRSAASRVGPCAVCRQRHPWHYGGPISSPLCDRCRVERGHEPMGEMW